MKPFHKLALTLIAVALFATNAFALCAGKTIYLEVPSGWYANNTVRYLVDGEQTITGTRNGTWIIFTFPSNFQNENGQENSNKRFAFYKDAGALDNNSAWIIPGANGYATERNSRPNISTAGFSCAESNFSSEGVMYIYQSPTAPGTTLVGKAPPNAYNFYFLPPKDAEWVLGSPYLVWNDGSKLQKEKLALDFSRCGWYKRTWFNATPPDGMTLIWLNEDGADQLGIKGLDEDPLDWIDGMPTPFSLLQQFKDVLGGTGVGDLFFMPEVGSPIWGTTDQAKDGICEYKFAAIIYDTDGLVNSSFDDANTAGSGTVGAYPCGQYGCSHGIVKGIPKQNLVFDQASGRLKMEFNKVGNGWTADNFRDAFKPTPGKNVTRCYDMPFKRNKSGLWEFNSSKLCKDGSMDLVNDCKHINYTPPASVTNQEHRAAAAYFGNFQGGYFPPSLNGNPPMTEPVYDADGELIRPPQNYTQAGCPECGNKRDANNFVRLDTTQISQFCYDRGRRGLGTNCGTEFGENEFLNGDYPRGATRTSEGIWRNDWGDVNGAGGKNYMGVGTTANQLFCFESAPAEFTYEPGQEFFFSGDDDIWVFINSKLVIDLGGTHLAAPGYVNMDAQAASLGLVAGEKYPINIFFCDRRLNMANVRIATDMYFEKKLSLYVEGNANNNDGAKVCKKEGGNATCECIIAGTCGGEVTLCGAEVALDYYLKNRRGERAGFNLDHSNESCRKSVNGNDLVCFGGITLVDYYKGTVGTVEYVKVNSKALTGLVGSYKLHAETKDGTEDVFVTNVIAEVGETQIWGRVVGDNGQLIYDLGPRHKKTVSGKRVPLGFSKGTWNCDEESRYGEVGCEFQILEESDAAGGSLGATVNIQNVSIQPGGRDAALLWYTDSVGGSPINKPNTGIVPANDAEARAQGHSFKGLLVYWVTGEYTASDDQTHTVGTAITVEVLLPRLVFIDPASRTALTAAQSQGTKYPCSDDFRDCGLLIGESTPRAVMALDPSVSPSRPCTTCNFRLDYNAWIEADGDRTNTAKGLIMQPSPSMPELIDGYADFSISGRMSVPGRNPLTNRDSLAFLTMNIQGGATSKADILAKWSNLIFEKPDTPYPNDVTIYDRDGDGFGDSLRIVYDRPFMKKPNGDADTLPSKIEVFWDPDSAFNSTLVFGPGIWNDNTKSWTSTNNPATDIAYWDGGSSVLGFSTRIEDSTTIVIYGDKLSKNIKTSEGASNTIVSWATFVNVKSGASAPADFRLGANINDKIPAIVVKALYEPGENCSGSGPGAGVACPDRVTILVSEPVVAIGDVSPDISKAPFAYRLTTRGLNDFQQFTDTKNLPVRFTHSSDSIFYMTYERYRSASDTTNTPMAGDSAKFASSALGGTAAFMDLHGNLPNPMEIGKPLEGTNPFEVDDIRIVELDPDKDVLEDKIKEIFQSGVGSPFGKDNPIALLPGGPGWTADTVKSKYPSSVGQLMKPDVGNIIGGIELEGGTVDPKDIVFHAKAYYHTSLGNFVVESKKLEIKCTDPIFTAFGDANCIGALPKGIYLAWNLKDAKNRWAGAGAYVEVYDFWWSVTYTDKKGQKQTQTYDKIDKKVSMHGVKRAKSKK